VYNFLQSIDPYAYRMLIIGDDTDDMEHEGGFYDNPFRVGIVRTFAYDELDDREAEGFAHDR
jgi:hypothetical protein